MITQFSASAAATSGFNLVRRRPRLLLVWALCLFLYYILSIVLSVAAMGPALAQAFTDPAAAEQAAEGAAGWAANGVGFVLSLAMAAIASAAVYRALLRPDERGFAYLRIGADEFRILAVVAIFTVGFLAVGGGGVALAVLAGAKVHIGLGVLVGVLVVFALFWLTIRLSLASVATFAERRIAIADSWRLTKGRFWPLLGTYLLSALIAWAAMLSIYLALLVVVGGGALFLGLSGAFERAAEHIGLLLAVGIPLALVLVAGIMLLGVVVYAIVLAPPAAIYRALRADPNEAAETFA